LTAVLRQSTPEQRQQRLQSLVDLLKQPLCIGEPRRLILEQLARHYQRPFRDQWDFVRFAEENNLDLDLTKPPKPDPRSQTP